MQRQDVLPAANGGREASPSAPVTSRLLIRPGALGDTIVWLPAVEAWCAARTEIWCASAHIPLVEHIGVARSIAGTGLDLLEIPGTVPSEVLLESLRGFDEIVSWYGAGRAEFRQRVSELGLPFRFFPTLPPQGGGVHAVDFYLAQAGAPPGGVPRLPVRRSDEGFAVIHPFSGSPRKNWPVASFRAVAAALEGAGLRVEWCAGPEEALAGARRFESLGELAAWLARARVYIGNDAGPTHLAAACGVPVVALFGPSDPRVWAPRGPRVAVARFDAAPEAVAETALRISA